MPEHTIPASLIDAIKSGNAVLVIGVGAGESSWKQLLEKLNEELDDQEDVQKDVAKLLSKGNLSRAAAFLGRALGPERCDKIAKELWQTTEEHSDVMKALAQLPVREVWTTHPGDMVEACFRHDPPQGWPAPQVKSFTDALPKRIRGRLLIKVLGDFASDNYAITPTSVRKALSSADDFLAHAKHRYTEGTLVFIGFRYGDPDLAALLDRVLGSFEPPNTEHYLLASGLGPVTVDELRAEHEIEVINLPGKGADKTATNSLLEFVNSLREQCDEAGCTLSQEKPKDDDLEGWLAVLEVESDNQEALEKLTALRVAAKEDGDADRRVEILLALAEYSEDGRAGALRELSQVYEDDIGDLPRAFAALTAALRQDPQDIEVLDAVERLATETESWSELVADVAEIAPEVEDNKVAAEYWQRLGRWYSEHLEHVDYAIASYRQAIKLDPALTSAYDKLAEMYRKQQRWAELADVLTAHVEVETDLDTQLDIYMALGDLCESQLASTPRAIEAYQLAAEIDEESQDALAALERLYKRDERWGSLAKVLEQRADRFDAAGDAQRASQIRRDLATLRAERLGDLEGAIAKYEAAFTADDQDDAALRALEDLYDKTGRTDDYIHTLERLSQVVPDSEKPVVLRRLAGELESEASGYKRAIACYERIVELEPSSEDAYRGLEQLLERSEQWYELATALEGHVVVAKSSTAKVALYVQLGNVYEEKLDDPHRAVEAYAKVLEEISDHRESLTALARLYERIEAWGKAADVVVRHAELDGNAKFWTRAGQLASTRIGDYELAIERFEKALEIEPTHTDAILGLVEVYRARKNWESAVSFLGQAETSSGNRLQRIDLLSQAALLCDNKLKDSSRALEYDLRILELDPEHVDAGTRASELLVRSERWADAIPVLEMLTRAETEDRLERAHRFAALGRAYDAEGMASKAADSYAAAVERDTGNLEAALGWGHALFNVATHHGELVAPDGDGNTEAWAEADKRYRDILARHRAGLSESQLVDAWYRLGILALGLDDSRKALDAFRRALELDSRHAPSLEALGGVAATTRDWQTVVDCKRDQLDDVKGEEKAKLLEDIGDIFRGKLEKPLEALNAYLEGVQAQPDSHVLLHKVLEVYTEQKEWRRAVDTLSTLATHETDAYRRSKYQYAAGVIARDELRDIDVAVERFNLALDDSPDIPKAFDAINRLLSDKGDWRALARAHRRMLKRLGDEASNDTLLPIWTRLGDICAEQLGDTEAAITAYEVASSLDHENVERHEQLANMYLEAGESRRADAIEELQFLIQHQPDRGPLYRRLFKLYMEEQDIDKAFCLAQALCFLGGANDEERAFYEEHKDRDFIFANRRLTEELWQKAIIHPNENRHLNAIFASLAAPIAVTTAQPPTAFNLKKSSTGDDNKRSLVSKVFDYTNSILGLTLEPQLYLQPESADGIRVANTKDDGNTLKPSVLVGTPHINKKDERELVFEVGKRMAYFRPERYVNYALQTLPKLQSAFDAAMSASGIVEDAPQGETAKLAGHLKKTVPTAVLGQIQAVGEKLRDRLGNGLVGGWRTATDLTADRVGLILCDDLPTAARMVATETPGVSTLSTKDRLRELLAYSVSDSYFDVRRHLGINVGAES